MGWRKCKECGVEFVPKTPYSYYCGIGCFYAAQRREAERMEGCVPRVIENFQGWKELAGKRGNFLFQCDVADTSWRVLELVGDALGRRWLHIGQIDKVPGESDAALYARAVELAG